MRIEKINDHQIRCTLNQKDLTDRELRISELAYGSERAKSLFRDMMQQASYEFGFEAEDIPLMVEAIPMYPDTLVLVITKVDDPEELDTRFSRFTEDDSDFDDMEDEFSFDEEIPHIDLFGFGAEEDEDESHSGGLATATPPLDTGNKESDFISLSEALGMEHRPKTKDYTASHDVIKIFSFATLQDLGSLAEQLVYQYHGQNTIYKDERKGQYYLVLHKTEHTPEEFSKICNIVGEYGKPMHNMYASHSYYEEHFEPLIRDKALQVLASL
jgi:adapter protein MecA 1/2